MVSIITKVAVRSKPVLVGRRFLCKRSYGFRSSKRWYTSCRTSTPPSSGMCRTALLREKSLIGAGWAFSAAACGCALGIVNFAADLSSAIAMGSVHQTTIVCGLTSSCVVLRAIFLWVQDVLLWNAALRASGYLREEAHWALLNRRFCFDSNLSNGDVVTRLTSDASNVALAMFQGLVRGLPQVVQAGAMICRLLLLSPIMTGAIAIGGPVMTIVIVVLNKALRSLESRSASLMGEIGRHVGGLMDFLPVMRVFNARHTIQSRFRQLSKEQVQISLRATARRLLPPIPIAVIYSLVASALLIVGAYIVKRKIATPDKIIAYMSGMILLIEPLQSLGGLSAELKKGEASLERINMMIGMEGDIKVHLSLPTKAMRTSKISVSADGSNDEDSTMPTSLHQIVFSSDLLKGELVVKSADIVSFDGRTIVLKGVRLHIPSDSFVTISGIHRMMTTLSAYSCQSHAHRAETQDGKESYQFATTKFLASGPSGVGKSSLAAALAGINPVARGLIHCGENESSDISIAYVPQKPVVLPSLSALENICLGRVEKDREKMASTAMNALQLAALNHLNFDLQSPLPPLSGGEAARLNIARALAVNPSCLVLDESFSALDQNTEDKVLRNLFRLRDLGKLSTIILVTHDSDKYAKFTSAQIVLSPGCVEYNTTRIA